MDTGRFPARLILCLCLVLLAQVQAETRQVVLHTTAVAGFAFHEAPIVWPQLRVGDVLQLEAEPTNSHDALAVKVLWQGHLLGYLPATENAPVSRGLQLGKPMSARIQSLREHPNPRERLRIDIMMPVAYD